MKLSRGDERELDERYKRLLVHVVAFREEVGDLLERMSTEELRSNLEWLRSSYVKDTLVRLRSDGEKADKDVETVLLELVTKAIADVYGVSLPLPS